MSQNQKYDSLFNF